MTSVMLKLLGCIQLVEMSDVMHETPPFFEDLGTDGKSTFSSLGMRSEKEKR